MPDGPRYEDDFYAWTQYQAQVLRTLRIRDYRFDREHVAEEIEDLGESERDATESQITRILEHFLKLTCSPADRPRYGLMGSIADARRILRKKLSATRRSNAEKKMSELYQDAREAAQLALLEHGEHAAAQSLPAVCPYTLSQVLDRDWYPEPSEKSK